MKKIVLAALTAGVMMLSIVPSYAGGSAGATYVAADAGAAWLPAAGVGVGGFGFETPTKPLTLDVDDVNGNGVGVTVCQENTSSPPDDLEQNCGGEGDDVSISFCTTGSPKNIGPQNFKPNSPFTVFVSASGATAGCSQVGIAGMMTVTW